MNACVNGCVSWIEMEGWSEYRFRVRLLQSRTGWNVNLCENVATICDISHWNVTIGDISHCGWVNSMLKMNGFIVWKGCLSWIEMEGWSEYRFRIDYCKAERLKCLLCENVAIGDIFTEMSPLGDISIVVGRIACWSEWMLVWMDVSAGLRWRDDLGTVVSHWLLQSRKMAEMPSVWKCHDMVTFLLKCHHLWYFYCGWINSLLEMNGFMCGELCQLDWDGGMIWVSVSHWFLQSRKAEMPSVWKCCDWWHF